MKFVRTDEKVTCPDHGDGAKVRVVYFGHPPMSVCYRCLDEAIEQYKQPLTCVDCGVGAKKGFGIEKDGVMIPLCPECQSKRLFGGNRADLGRTDQSDESSRG